MPNPNDFVWYPNNLNPSSFFWDKRSFLPFNRNMPDRQDQKKLFGLVNLNIASSIVTNSQDTVSEFYASNVAIHQAIIKSGLQDKLVRDFSDNARRYLGYLRHQRDTVDGRRGFEGRRHRDILIIMLDTGEIIRARIPRCSTEDQVKFAKALAELFSIEKESIDILREADPQDVKCPGEVKLSTINEKLKQESRKFIRTTIELGIADKIGIELFEKVISIAFDSPEEAIQFLSKSDNTAVLNSDFTDTPLLNGDQDRSNYLIRLLEMEDGFKTFIKILKERMENDEEDAEKQINAELLKKFYDKLFLTRKFYISYLEQSSADKIQKDKIGRILYNIDSLFSIVQSLSVDVLKSAEDIEKTSMLSLEKFKLIREQ